MRTTLGYWCAIELIANCACSTGARGQFLINFGKRIGQWRQSEFGVGSKPAGRRLRPPFRGLRSDALAVAGGLGWLVGLAGGLRHGDELMGDVNWEMVA